MRDNELPITSFCLTCLRPRPCPFSRAVCGVDFAYLLPAAAGQVELLANSVPIEDAISAGTLTDEQIEKLKLIEDVRDYASGVIGLVVNDNYTTFYDSRGEDVAYNISACRKGLFHTENLDFPVCGDSTLPRLLRLLASRGKTRLPSS